MTSHYLNAFALTTRLLRRFLSWRVRDFANDNGEGLAA